MEHPSSTESEFKDLFPEGSERFFDNYGTIEDFAKTGNPEPLIENPEALLGLCDFLYNTKDDKDAKELRRIRQDSKPLYTKKAKFALRKQAIRNNKDLIREFFLAFLEEKSEQVYQSSEEEEEGESSSEDEE